MRRSKADIFLHFVWATYQRQPLITPEIESQIYGVILSETRRLRVEVFAVGGMPDHIHLVLRKPPNLSESQVMQRIKGVSSTIARQEIIGAGEQFRWQEHYGVFSFHRRQLDNVVAYVRQQKTHHGTGELKASWEETDEEAPQSGDELAGVEI